MKWLLLLAAAQLLTSSAHAETRIAVFVGLADNATQGIAKVPAKIGDGDRPAENLYWGCTEGLKAYFKASPVWKLQTDTTATGDSRILERLTFRHGKRDAVLVAEAWRGSNLPDCYRAFQGAAVSGDNALVVFLGHNVLMDALIEPPATRAPRPTDAMVLCCKSESFFRERIEAAGLRPVLMTQQSMYPGSFLLHDALEPWLAGRDRASIRAAAGTAYARNQKISVAAATGVFANLDLPNLHPIRQSAVPQPGWRLPSGGWWLAVGTGVILAAGLLALRNRNGRTKDGSRDRQGHYHGPLRPD